MERRKAGITKNDGVIADAQAHSLLVVFSDPKMLLIDCDSQGAFDTVCKNIQWGRGLLGAEKAWYTRSKGGNWHVYVQLVEPLPQLDRVLLQGALGGDPRRTLLDWSRTEQGIGPEASVLFEYPDPPETTPIDLGNECSDTYGGPT